MTTQPDQPPFDTRSVSSHDSAPAHEPRPVNRAAVFTVVVAPLMMMAVDSTIVATALHAMQEGLQTTVNWVAWTLTAFSFGRAVMLPISGKLGEHYGHRTVFLGSVITFTLASLLCGLANSIFLMIALRAMQAGGGAGFTPAATGIIVDHFGPARDRAVSFFGSIFPIGAMLGPIFGGLFVTYWSWRGIFFVNVPIGIAVVLLALKYIPQDRPRAATPRAPMDRAGIALLATALLTGMLAITYVGDADERAMLALVAIAAAVSAGTLWAFFRHIGRSAAPFIAPHLIFGRNFGAVNLANAIFGGAAIGAVALVPFYASSRYGLSALDAGTLLIAQGVTTIISSVTVTLMLRRTGYRAPIYAGVCIMILGMSGLAMAPPVAGLSPYGWLAIVTGLIGLGAGIINPATRNAGLQLAPQHSATLAALRSLALQIGSILAVSIASAAIALSGGSSTVFAAVYAVIAALFLVSLPLVRLIPEHRGAW